MEEGWIGKAMAELIGTFGLVFFGAGSIVMTSHLMPKPELGPGASSAQTALADSLGGAIGGVSLIAVAAVHAIVLAIVVTATMNISGGHINPAVTFGAWLTKKIPAALAGVYVLAQLGGGILGAAFVKALLPAAAAEATNYGATLVNTQDITLLGAVSLELVLTFFLVFTVFGTGISKHAPKVGGFAIGLCLFFDAMIGGTLTGASMNPARSLGPALIGNIWTSHWIYWVGPLLGGALAAAVYDGIVEKGADEPDAPAEA